MDTFGLYLKEIGRFPMLSRAEERWLTTRLHNARHRALSLRAAGDPVGSRAAMQEFDGYLTHLVEANLRLVVSCTKQVIHSRDLLPEAIQEGNIGLIRAAELFDASRDIKFSTYAYWWITQRVTRWRDMQFNNAVHVPPYIVGQLKRAKWTSGKMLAELGRYPTPEELEQALEVSAPEAQTLLKYMRNQNVSLCEVMRAKNGDGDDLASQLPYIIEDKTETLRNVELRGMLNKLLATIKDDRWRRIIRLRFGLDGEPCTLEEIGQLLGISKERVRQVEAKAMACLRVPTNLALLGSYVEDFQEPLLAAV